MVGVSDPRSFGGDCAKPGAPAGRGRVKAEAMRASLPRRMGSFSRGTAVRVGRGDDSSRARADGGSNLCARRVVPALLLARNSNRDLERSNLVGRAVED